MDFLTFRYFCQSFVLPVSFALLYIFQLDLAFLSNQGKLCRVDSCLNGTYFDNIAKFLNKVQFVLTDLRVCFFSDNQI